MRIKRIISGTLSLGLLVAGALLIGAFFMGQAPGILADESTQQGSGAASGGQDPSGFSVPQLEGGSATAGGPEDKTLEVTIPAMSRIENDTVPDAAGDNERALKENAAIHLRGTGFPWQKESNTYLAGHRLGYPGTESFLAFYDLTKLEEGDEVYVEDAEGTEYTYRVYRSFVTEPSDLSVTKPVDGKNILTLQTCTLPDYSDRLIVQAELVEKG